MSWLGKFQARFIHMLPIMYILFRKLTVYPVAFTSVARYPPEVVATLIATPRRLLAREAEAQIQSIPGGCGVAMSPF